ncbi:MULTISPECIES: hypothetical protein [unclassified Nocardia]|uniref:hypothetical protein n=1 Tax=unclassified Nocardia TaxID=2637762 RepID=UPI0024A9B869|nr:MULTISPECIES: hypothetical protein [unclassified Nocardia]
MTEKSWRDEEGRWHLTPEDRAERIKRGNERRRVGQALLDALTGRVPQKVLAQLRTFHSVGEYPMLFSNLAAALVNHNIPITSEERDLLCEMLYSIEPTIPDAYPSIRDRDQVMVSLNVVQADGAAGV